jgi:hypothetical protein
MSVGKPGDGDDIDELIPIGATFSLTAAVMSHEPSFDF